MFCVSKKKYCNTELVKKVAVIKRMMIADMTKPPRCYISNIPVVATTSQSQCSHLYRNDMLYRLSYSKGRHAGS